MTSKYIVHFFLFFFFLFLFSFFLFLLEKNDFFFFKFYFIIIISTLYLQQAKNMTNSSYLFSNLTLSVVPVGADQLIIHPDSQRKSTLVSSKELYVELTQAFWISLLQCYPANINYKLQL